MSKTERNERTELEKRQAERSKRKEDRHHAHPDSGAKHAGSLVEDGYTVEEGQDRRRTALNKAAHKHGYAEVVEKIKALAAMNKSHKENSRRIRDDLEYLSAKLKDKETKLG